MFIAKWKNDKLRNLPKEMIAQKKFCIWKSEPSESGTGKPKKVPYLWIEKKGICRNFPKGPFLSFFMLQGFLVLQQDLPKKDRGYSAGFYLKDSGLSVIDIDNYQAAFGLGDIVSRLDRKGCYVEASPSGEGLHIFYSGSLDWTNGRKRSFTSLETYEGKGTSCEVYGPNDVRFITLTGNKLTPPSKKNSSPLPLPDAEELQEEFQELKELFFLNPFEEVSSSDFSSNSTLSTPSIESYSALPDVDSKLELVLSKIKDSRFYQNFLLFSENLKVGTHNSISETDMAFAGLVAAYIPQEWAFNEKIDLIIQFFKHHRIQRDKSRNRLDYIRGTAEKALLGLSPLGLNNREQSKSSQDQKPLKTIERSSILKICNVMQIFHLGKSKENFKYINNRNPDNSVEATCPESLSSTDFKYFMQLLFQYKESKLFSNQNSPEKNDYYEINIHKLGQELGASISGGRNYKMFLDSLSKLSKVHLKYNKVIDLDKKSYSISEESLLSYRVSYESDRSTGKRSYKKLKVRMHSTIFEVLSSAEYNYSLINQESYNKLSSDKLQLLYFHFCQKTLPGKEFRTFTLEDLLSLWPSSDNRHTIHSRVEQLTNLIKDLTSERAKLKDIYIQPIYENGKLVKVKVKKNKLNIV